MQLSATHVTTTAPAATAAATPATAGAEGAQPEAGGGVQGFIGDVLRAGAAGYQAVTHQASVQSDKALIHPFEGVLTGTALLKEKTKDIKGVGKATGLLHTVAGFGMLILTSNIGSQLRAPGDTVSDLAGHVADAIDGKDSKQGWSIGWGMRSDEAPDGGEDEDVTADAPVATAQLGQLGDILDANGMQ